MFLCQLDHLFDIPDLRGNTPNNVHKLSLDRLFTKWINWIRSVQVGTSASPKIVWQGTADIIKSVTDARTRTTLHHCLSKWWLCYTRQSEILAMVDHTLDQDRSELTETTSCTHPHREKPLPFLWTTLGPYIRKICLTFLCVHGYTYTKCRTKKKICVCYNSSKVQQMTCFESFRGFLRAKKCGALGTDTMESGLLLYICINSRHCSDTRLAESHQSSRLTLPNNLLPPCQQRENKPH